MRGDYSNGRIYFIEPICEHEDNEFYYGSTIQKLCKRMDKHRRDFKSWKDDNKRKIMCFELFEKYGIENCKIELVELVPCNSLEELRAREGFYIRNNKCVNKCIPHRTPIERYEDNKEQISEKHKQYYEENKEEHNKKTQLWYKNNKEYHRTLTKQYYEENKEQILERTKQYREENKEQISEKKKERYQANLRCKILENNSNNLLDEEKD
jgi:hypothetical protein